MKRYCDGQSIVTLALHTNYPPYLLSRFLVEEISFKGSNKKSLGAIMKQPAAFLNNNSDIKEKYAFSEVHHPATTNDGTRLAAEVMKAIECDPMYGPSHDRQRHLIGVEYEVLLELQLNELSEDCVVGRLVRVRILVILTLILHPEQTFPLKQKTSYDPVEHPEHPIFSCPTHCPWKYPTRLAMVPNGR